MSNDFGYVTSSGTKVVRGVGAWVNRYDRRYPDDEVTPVQVVAPGQVAVDAADLRLMINHIGHDVTATPKVIDASDRVQREIDRAALAAANPAPDSGQGETVEHTDKCCMIGVDPAAGPHPDCPGVAEVQRVASGGGTEADGDRSAINAALRRELHKASEQSQEQPAWTKRQMPAITEAFAAATEPAPDSGQGEAKRSNLVHWHTPDQGRALDCPEKPDADGNLRGHCVMPELWDTPAAEPQRVTLPDPTPPIVWTAADDEAWRPERITFNDAEYVRAQPPTPDPAETDALTDSERADMHERNKHPHRHDSTCPTCDYPERVTPNGARAIAEQAAARGRDEALAVVVEALREAVRAEGSAIGSALHGVANDIDSARADFEAGGGNR